MNIVTKEGKTQKDGHEFLQLIPNRNPAVCAIASYGYLLMWRFFSPESGLTVPRQ